jgi:hypothetical protein
MMRLNHIRRLGKEIEMRTGNVILFILLVLIGFGFLLYYSIDMTRELTETREHLTQVQAAMQTLEIQYQVLVEENGRLNGQVVGLTEQNTALQSRLTIMENERITLQGQIEILQGHLADYEKAHSFITWLESSPSVRLATALIVVPGVPISFGVVYMATHHKASASHRTPGENLPPFQTTLTPEEFQFLVQRRQSRLPAHLAARRIDTNSDKPVG